MITMTIGATEKPVGIDIISSLVPDIDFVLNLVFICSFV